MRPGVLFSALALLALACGSGPDSSEAAGDPPASSAGSEDPAETSPDAAAPSSSDQASGDTADGQSFALHASSDAAQAHGEQASEIEATATHAAMRLFVVDPETGPIEDIVVKLVGDDGQRFYTDPTDTQGYAEVLVPAGQHYALEYLALGRRSQRANVTVPDGPNQDIRLTLRHRRWRAPRRATPPADPAAPTASPSEPPPAEGIVLHGVLFDTASAVIHEDSYPRLDRVVEYLFHHADTRVRISGHTDNQGNARSNLRLSQERAEAVRAYLIANGIEEGRVEAVGYGDTRPVASNETEEGRSQNRRIEAEELD